MDGRLSCSPTRAKLDHRPFHAWTKLPLPWTVVTDEAADHGMVGRLRDRDIEVVVAPSHAEPS